MDSMTFYNVRKELEGCPSSSDGENESGEDEIKEEGGGATKRRKLDEVHM